MGYGYFKKTINSKQIKKKTQWEKLDKLQFTVKAV